MFHKNPDTLFKLIIVDLDNTLVPSLGMPPRDFSPSEKLIKLIKKLQKSGITISLCTGRDKLTMLRVIKN